jgi:hypothetical protein
MPQGVELFLYTRAVCPLCDVFRSRLDARGLAYHTIDVDTDPELKHRYGARLPVLVGGDFEICEGHYNDQAVDRYLQGR